MIGYIRVSTQGQEEGYGIDTQKNEINAWATAHNTTIDKFVYETGSGAKERPLLEDVIYNEPDDIVVFKFDRVARDTKLFFYYSYQLERKGKKIISTQEEVYDDAMANIYMAFIQFAAEQERKNILLRTSKGKKEKALKGGYCGGNTPYGYTNVGGKLVINENEIEIVKCLFKMRGSLRDKADRLNSLGYSTRSGGKFTHNVVNSILKNKDFYKGTYSYGDIRTKGDYELCL